MKTDSNPAMAASLRRRAEALLLGKCPKAPLSGEDLNARRLYHELQVYQIELDMQNEELQRISEALVAAEQKCISFRDFFAQRCALTESSAPIAAVAPVETCGQCTRQDTINRLHARVATLSPREHQVLGELVQGRCTKNVAQCLNISPRTVELHRSRILKKLRFASFHELLASPIKCLLARAN